MGASLSIFFTADTKSSSSSQSNPNLDDIPEGCVALILTHLDPPEISKLGTLSRAFRGASTADFVWDLKLPSNYQLIAQKLFDGSLENLGKKKIYERLCRVNPFDGNYKSVWLDKRSGGVCMSISSKGLAITGIDDRRFWNHISTEESRFPTVAYLQHTWWLQVDGEVDFPFPPGTYTLSFRLQLGRSSKNIFNRRVCNSKHVNGWNTKPVRFQMWTSDGQHSTSQYYLSEPGKWNNYHVGDFVVEKPNASTKVKFSMTQIDCTHAKGGLCLDSVLIHPSNIQNTKM